MSSFYCEKCNALIQDTPRGYITECEHYPLDLKKSRRQFWASWGDGLGGKFTAGTYAAPGEQEGK